MQQKTKIVLSIIGIVVLAVGIVAGTYLVRESQDIREKAAPSTTLSFFPTVVTKNPGQTFSLTINADTGSNKITGIDIEISYDPSAIQLTQMKGTTSIAPLSSIIKNGVIDNTAGKARFVAYTAVKTDAISGSLDILDVSGNILSGVASGQFPITFTATTTVSAVDEGQNVVISSTPATITVSTGSVSATATATATATSAAATATATSTSRATATATATSRATATATATSAGGVGGSNLKTATPTTKPTTNPTATATTAGASATTPPDLPVTGVSLPFLGSAVLGIGAIILSLFLAF